MPVKVKVLFFARLREELGVKEVFVELNRDDPTLRDVLDEVSLRIPKASFLTRLLGEKRVYVMLNGEYVKSLDRRVRDGDELAIFPPTSGG